MARRFHRPYKIWLGWPNLSHHAVPSTFEEATNHAASLQSFLDTCSQGHFDNSSAWLPLHAHCRHVVPQEHAGRHIAPNDPGATSCFPRSHKPLWLHVAGDSTMRFFYAGLLSFFNGTAHRAPALLPASTRGSVPLRR